MKKSGKIIISILSIVLICAIVFDVTLVNNSKKENKSIFELFNDDMFISGEYSGKLLHTYLDDEQEFDCIDYLGNKEHVISLSGVHLEPSSYSLSLADKYKNYLNHIQTKYKKGD